jgi:hypothetical protein
MINDIYFDEIDFFVNKKTNDTILIKGIIKQKTIIDSIPCYGKIAFSNGWNLKKFTLAEDHVFVGHIFPKDSYIMLHVAINSLIRPYFNASKKGSGYNQVNLCKFKTDQIINGLSCDTIEAVFFDDDWNLIGCVLSAEDTVAGNIFKKSTFIRVNWDRTITCFCPYDPFIQGYNCSGTDYTGKWMGGGGIKLHPNGRLAYFQPLEEIEIQGVWCKPSSVRGGIFLYENGKLMRCTSARKQIIDGTLCQENFTLKFDETGKLIYSVKDKIFPF